jgi:HEAT repeat protein
MENISALLEKLKAASETERAYAAEDLGDAGSPDVILPLIAHLQHESSPAVQDAIFQSLLRLEGDDVIAGCMRLLESPDTRLRNQAVAVLRSKGERAVASLKVAMRDGNKTVKKLALDALNGMHALEAGEIYAAALSDADPNVVITAIENLGNIRSAKFRSWIEEILQSAEHPMLVTACIEALVGIGHPSSLAVIRQRFPDLASVPDFLLASCLKAFAALGSQADFPEITSLLLVRSPHLYPAILNALISIYPDSPPEPANEVLTLLFNLVKTAEPLLCRYQAVRVLGFWVDLDAVFSFLAESLSNPERLVRLGAAEALRAAERPGLEGVLASRASEECDAEVLEALRR